MAKPAVVRAVVVFGTAGVLLVAGALFAGRYFKRDREVRQLSKTIAALDFTMRACAQEDPKYERELLKGDATAWRTLDATESRWLLENLSRQMTVRADWFDTVRADPWGHPLRFEVRRKQERIDFRVTSAGPDGVFDNDDDYDSIEKRVSLSGA